MHKSTVFSEFSHQWPFIYGHSWIGGIDLQVQVLDLLVAMIPNIRVNTSFQVRDILSWTPPKLSQGETGPNAEAGGLSIEPLFCHNVNRFLILLRLTGMLKLWGKSNLANNTFKRLLKSFLNLSPILKIPSFSPSDSEDQGARGWQDAQIFGNKGKVVQAGHCTLSFLLLCHQNRTSNINLWLVFTW